MFLSTCTLDLCTHYMYKLVILWVNCINNGHHTHTIKNPWKKYSVVTSVISYCSLGPLLVNVTLIRIELTRFPNNRGSTVVCHEVGTVYSIWQAFLINTNLQNRRTLLCNLGEQKWKLGDREVQVAHKGMHMKQTTCPLLLAHDLSSALTLLSHLFN